MQNMQDKNSPIKAPISISRGGRKLDLDVLWDQRTDHVWISGVEISTDVNITKLKVVQHTQVGGTQGICTGMRQVI